MILGGEQKGFFSSDQVEAMGLGGLGTPVSHPQPHQGPIQTTPLLIFPRFSWMEAEVIAWM